MSNTSTENSGGTEGAKGAEGAKGTEGTTEGTGKVFTQEEVNRMMGEARRTAAASERSKFADYDTLKAKAEGAKSVEEQLADLQRQNQAMARDALAARVAAKHKISPEDADLFLTGADEETLNTQAARLAAFNKQQAESKEQPGRRPGGLYTPLEGRGSNNNGVSDDRRAVRALFGGAGE